MPCAELGINGLKSWGRDWWRKVEKSRVLAARNAGKPIGVGSVMNVRV
jgi:hypothetical protein